MGSACGLAIFQAHEMACGGWGWFVFPSFSVNVHSTLVIPLQRYIVSDALMWLYSLPGGL